jgi:hypothetical protein
VDLVDLVAVRAADFAPADPVHNNLRSRNSPVFRAAAAVAMITVVVGVQAAAAFRAAAAVAMIMVAVGVQAAADFRAAAAVAMIMVAVGVRAAADFRAADQAADFARGRVAAVVSPAADVRVVDFPVVSMAAGIRAADQTVSQVEDFRAAVPAAGVPVVDQAAGRIGTTVFIRCRVLSTTLALVSS